MKKYIILTAFLFMTLSLFPQVEQHAVTVTNVVVPVRVLDGNSIVNNMTIEDFELYEEGKLQKIEALYFVQKTDIERKETLKEFFPALSRHYYLLFQLTDYDPKLAEAIEYLFNYVLLPDDALTIMTPMHNYSLSKKAFKIKSKETIAKEMIKIVRKDTKTGSSNYKSILRNLKRLVSAIQSAAGFEQKSTDVTEFQSQFDDQSFGLEMLLPRYRNALKKMEELRFVDEKKFLQFAQALKRQRYQKNVFFFYQREYRPEIQPRVLNQMMSLWQENPNILADLMDLFQHYHRSITIDADKIKQAFADSSILFNFIFMDKIRVHASGIFMREQSEDIFRVFSDVAEATGGIMDNSQNPSYAFKKAIEASESYYLLYYSPTDYNKDGKFKSIKVRVINEDYKIIYRQGYFAN